MLKLILLTFSCLLDHGAEMLDEMSYISPSFHWSVSLFSESDDIVLAINVDIAQVKVLQRCAKLEQGCPDLDKLTSLYFAE